MIFTIGYAGRNFKDLLKVLQDNKIRLIIDVRRWPTSKWKIYARENLNKELKKHNIGYFWLGRELGGYRGSYEKWMVSKEFKSGIERLLKLQHGTRACILCLERNWRDCHRRYIVRYLRKVGKKVKNF